MARTITTLQKTIVIDIRKWSLYYKRGIALVLALAVVINNTPWVMLQIVVSLTIVIYNCKMFII